MSNKWCFTIQSLGEVETKYTVSSGEQLFVLGSNGSGKSKLLRYINSCFDEDVYMVTPSRDVRFRSSVVNITEEQRSAVKKDLVMRDEMDDGYYSRFVHERGGVEEFAVMFDFEGLPEIENLKNPEAVFESSEGAELEPHTHKNVLIGTDIVAKDKDYIPLISQINEILIASYFYFQVEYLPKEWKMIAKRRGDDGCYGIHEMSDGECAVLHLICNVMIAPPNSLILIDEPERHLHASNVFPLLSKLFSFRNDCAFVVATHEINNIFNKFPKNKTILLYDYSYNKQAWEYNIISNSTCLGEKMLSNILGPRHPVIFVEGKLDSLTYAPFFPSSRCEIVEGCDKIIGRIKELRKLETSNLSPRISAIGIIDKDNRSDDDCEQLQTYNIFALKYYSIESLYYHPKTIRAMLAKSGKSNEWQTSVFLKIEKYVMEKIDGMKKELSARMSLRKIEEKIKSLNPSHKEIIKGPETEISYNWNDDFNMELSSIKNLLTNKDMAALIERYPVKIMGICQFIHQQLKYGSPYLYEEDVRNKLFLNHGEDNLLSPLIKEIRNKNGL